MPTDFQNRLGELQAQHRALIERPNRLAERHNGIYQRWVNPILTADHTPLFWRYDLDPNANPFLMERIGDLRDHRGRARPHRQGAGRHQSRMGALVGRQHRCGLGLEQ